MRLTESNEELVEVHPPSVDFIPSGLFRVGRATDERGNRAEVYMDGDFPEIFVFSVMVLRAIVIHTMEDIPHRSDTFLSFVAFKKSIEDAGESPR